MKKDGHPFLLVIETVVYIALFAVVLVLDARGVASSLPRLPLIVGMPSVALLAAVGLAWRTRPGLLMSFRSVVRVSLVINSAVIIATNPAAHAAAPFSDPLTLLSLGLVVLYAATGEPRLFTAVLLLYLLGESAPLALEAYPLNDAAAIERLLVPLSAILRRAGVVTAVGLLAFAAGRRRRGTTPDIPPPGRKPAGTASPAAPSVPAADEEHSELVASKTRSFSLNYISELQHAAGLNLDNLLSSVVYFMSRNFRAYSSLGFIYNPQKRCFVLNSSVSKSMAVAKGIEIPLGHGIVGSIGTEKRSFMSGDVANYGRGISYYTSIQMINSVLAVPVISDTGELLGALVIDSTDRSAFREHHKETLKRFSTLAAALITNVRMRVQQELTARQFQLLYQVSQQFTSLSDTDGVLGALVDVLPRMTSCTRVLAMTFDAEAGKGVISKLNGDSRGLREGMSFPVNDGLYSYVYKTAKPVNIPDLEELHQRFYTCVPDEAIDRHTRSMLVLPIGDESRCFGVVSMESVQPGAFRGETEQVLSTLVSNASVAFVRAMLYQKMVRLATTDGLTGLTNHRTFQENLAREVHRACRYGRPLSLVLMDIDHFKKFNDTYGHPVGDLVLREIAGCIRRSLRVNDLPARYGGEEFAVIVPETDREGVIITAERIRTTIEAHRITTDSLTLQVTVSLGCATLPVHADTPSALIDCADKALYHSKETGRNRVTVFGRKMV